MQDVPKELWVIAENAIEDGTLVAANREQRNTDDYRYVKSEAEASNLSDLLSAKYRAKLYVDANVWDGEDRAGCHGDSARFTPDELQELIDEVLDNLST